MFTDEELECLARILERSNPGEVDANGEPTSARQREWEMLNKRLAALKKPEVIK